MTLITDILKIVYFASALALAIYSLGTYVLIVIWWFRRNISPPLPVVKDADLPTVTIQLPVYNEREVVGRLIDAVAALDYPHDRLHIQVLDDSRDDTCDVITYKVAAYARRGVSISHIRRPARQGYKAGALADAASSVTDELVAVFDADFVPSPDFLRRTVPYFHKNPQLGMVQVRWGHLNPAENWLARAQVLSLDGHFVVEQTARSRGGLLLNFSGSGGVWRTACIQDAGGWSFATLAEDLDLSFRAQMRGWRFLYVPEVVVKGEIPPQIAAYKQQQSRWAKGNIQNLLRHSGTLWHSPYLNFGQKFMGTLHLCQYVVHPLMLILLLLTPPLLYMGVLEQVALAPLGLAGLGPPIVFLLSQQYLYDDWPRRMLAFPVLLGLGTGLAMNNTVAVFSALRGEPNVFQRTPKFRGQAWQNSNYALRSNWTVAAEGFLALYSAAGGFLAMHDAPSLVPFMFAYAYAFGMVMLWSLIEMFQLRRNSQRSESTAERLSI
jgi:cellulose synthase/poly-beta-1,6-N-acetylglucosamine synthase-like glycosyltransferase